jgi:hypothetical protein
MLEKGISLSYNNRDDALKKFDYQGIPAVRKFNLSDYAEKLLTAGIVSAVLTMGLVIGIMIFHFDFVNVNIFWKIGIATFILLLPFSLFLQASLNAEAVKDEKHSTIQNRFRSACIVYSKRYPDKTNIANEDLEDEKKFRLLIEDRSLFLMFDNELYSIYQQAYHIYLLYKKKHLRIKGVSDENDLKHCLLRFELNGILSIILKKTMKEDGTDFRAYLLPLSFFLFMYFAGFLLTLPLIESIFTGTEITTSIPLFKDKEGIPIIVIQWGFLGGLVYTSISLLNRFLRNDLVPRVYFNASFRLILSAVVAITIYFMYMIRGGTLENVPPQILLLCFLAGVAPVQFLIHFADTQLSKLNGGWKRKTTAGNKPVTQIEGIDSVTAERLSEEGIDCIRQMALCHYDDLASKTNFPSDFTKDWKNQAIFITLTGDKHIDIIHENNEHFDSNSILLSDLLDTKLAIHTISSLIDLWENMKNNENPKEKQKSLFKSIGILEKNEENFDQIYVLFENITKDGSVMQKNHLAENIAVTSMNEITP